MKKQHHQQAGFTLVTILAVITVLTLSLGALFRMGGQRTFSAKRMINRTKALAYAEAGIEFAYSRLSVDFTLRDDLDSFSLNGGTVNADGAMENSYGDGSFALSLSPSSNRYCVVTSKGVCGGQSFTAEIVSEDFNAGTGGSTPPRDYTGMEGFNYPTLSNGEFSSNGDVTITSGTGDALIHTNGDMDLTKKQAENGANRMTASGIFTKPQNGTPINGASGVPPVSIPDIDLTPYENEAAANGMVINVGDPIPNPVVGGILVIRGSGPTTIDSDIAATIIAEGTLDVKAATIHGAGYSLGLVSKNGDIIMNGNGSMNGLTYTETGNFTMHGTPRLEGQLIINGTTTFGGTPDAFLFKKTVLTPPGTDGTTTPYVQDVRVSGWQK